MPKGTRTMVFECNTRITQKAVNIHIFLNKILYWSLTHNAELRSVLFQLLKNKARKNVFRPSSLKTVQSVLQFNKIFKIIIWTIRPILLISGQNNFFCQMPLGFLLSVSHFQKQQQVFAGGGRYGLSLVKK